MQVFPQSLQWVAATYASYPAGIFDILQKVKTFAKGKIAFYKGVLPMVFDTKQHKSLAELLKPTPSMYSHSNYNSRGDFIGHLGKLSPGMVCSDVICYPEYRFRDESEQVLAEFSTYARSKGAEVVIVPAVLPVTVYKKWKSRADDIYRHWKGNPKLVVLGNPERYTFPLNWFYDTPYHLMAQGRQIRTLRLIEDLKDFRSSLANSGSSL